MASKINYNNKAPFQTLEEIPDENKVNAADMNEIKTVVNNNADELDTAKENIENLENGQGTSNAEITSLKTRVSALETDNSTNKTNISNLEENKVDKVEGKGLSTEDFTTVLKSKLEGLENYDDTEIKEDISSLKTEQEEQNNRLNILEEDNTTNKQDISNIKSEQTEQDKQIDMLINALPSETQEAENINIKGTIPVKFKEFVVGGNSKQETRSGKNIVNINSADIVNIDTTIEVENNTLTVTGSSTNNFYSAIPIKLKPNTDYSISTLATVVEQNGLSQSAYIRVRSDLAGSWIGNSILINKDLTTQQNLKGTFNSGDNENAYLILYLSPLNDGTQRSAKIEFENLQVEEGSTATDYEPYGAMPSPEYPSEIKNVEGNVDITVCNKNLLNWDKVIQDSENVSKTDDGYIKFFQGDKRIKINYAFKENTQYAFTLIGKREVSNSNLALRFYYSDGSSQDVYIYCANANTEYSKTFISQLGKTISYIQSVFSDSVVSYIKIEGTQLEEGNIATDYTQHQSQTITFPLQEGQKLMKGDYLADDGIHHVRKQIIFDGTEAWCKDINKDDIETDYFYITNTSMDLNKTEEFLCTHFVYQSGEYGLQGFCSTQVFIIKINKEYTGIVEGDDKETRINKFKAYLSQQKQAGTPVIVEYELAEEEIEAYTPEQQEAYNQLKQLIAYEKETNIYSTNEVGPIFSVTAIKDFNSVITQLNKALLERS